MEIPSIHPEQDFDSSLVKHSGCVGRLEDIANWFCRRQGKKVPDMLHAAVALFAADHGVGMALAPAGERESTAERVRSSMDEHAVIRTLCQRADTPLHVIDVGVAADLSAVGDELEHAKVRAGSANIATEPAMEQADYWEAVGIGEEVANRMIDDGANLLLAGSLSSHDQISVAALIAELVGLSPEELLCSASKTDHSLHLQQLVMLETALARAEGTSSHDILRELGGLELAAMAGFYRAAAQRAVPVLLDGVASTAAALAAVAWDVRIAGWMLASHSSDDAGHCEALEELGLEPLMELHHSIDGATAAVLLLPVLESGVLLKRGLSFLE